MEENGDCLHCCGDHKAANCYRKERVCGGGKVDRGCNKSHNMHELFCPDAKVFSSQVVSMGAEGSSDGVVPSIMNIRVPKKGLVASVFWDLGCTSNFV